MTVWTAGEIAAILGGGQGGPGSFSSISTDTRTLKPGALFVALVGENFDGHDFLVAARDAGAAAAVVRRGAIPVEGFDFYEVDDPLRALGFVARARRRKLSGPVVGVTGSNGKTSTKEMLAAVLRTRWRVHSTRGNLNNLVGVPLSILEAPESAEALVLEAGASVPGEIERLREIIEPTIGVVTNVFAAHLEGFGSFETVLAEKVALLRDVPLAVVGVDPPDLAVASASVAGRVVSAGLDASAGLAPDSWSLDAQGRPVVVFRGIEVRLPLIGAHQAANAMLALAVAEEEQLDLGPVADALAKVAIPTGRLELMCSGDLVVLNDTYNSNPASLRASLEAASRLRGDRPLVVVVGSMLELGPDTAKLHEEMAVAVIEVEPQLIAALGDFIPAFAAHRAELGDRLLVADDVTTMGRMLGERLTGRAIVLLKASRGVGLDRAIPYFFTAKPGEPCSSTF